MTGSDLRWSDVWLLTSLWYASRKRPADLVDLLAVADLINHAVPNPEELQSGLVRLREAGLIEQEEGAFRFRCSSKAVGVIEPFASESKTLRQLWKELEARLGATQWTPGEPLPHPANDKEYPGFTTDTYAQAVEQYQRRMRSRSRK